MTDFILKQLLALYFSGIYSWQLSSDEKSLVGIRLAIYFKDFTGLDFFCTHIFFISFCLVGYAKV